MKITRYGRVIVTPEGITVEGFDLDDGSCRDLANLASAWAIAELGRELRENIAEPGGGDIAID